MPRGGKRPNAGRPLKYGDVTVHRSVSIPADLDEAISQQADQYGVSKNEIIVGNLYKILMRGNI